MILRPDVFTISLKIVLIIVEGKLARASMRKPKDIGVQSISRTIKSYQSLLYVALFALARVTQW